jgi:hypothetical protein
MLSVRLRGRERCCDQTSSLRVPRQDGSLKWWTRSKIVRTAGELPFEAALFKAVVPVFRRIATASRQLRALGMSFEAIARQLGVSEKTVAKSLRN